MAERNFEREIFRNYDIKILNIRDDGTMDFFLAGYMNAGEYEGRTGIVLYSYDYKENLREEKMYMPINSSYQILTTDLADFAYYSEDQVFYFSIYSLGMYYIINPLSWPFTIIPNLPPNLFEVIDSPIPLLIGILGNKDSAEEINEIRNGNCNIQ